MFTFNVSVKARSISTNFYSIQAIFFVFADRVDEGVTEKCKSVPSESTVHENNASFPANTSVCEAYFGTI